LGNLVRWRAANTHATRRRDESHCVAPSQEAEDDGPLESMPAPADRPAGEEGEFEVIVTEAMAALSSELSPRELQLLDLYYCKEWPAKRVADALGMTTSNVFVAAHRHKLKLCAEIKARL
jgi:RNA polymerase sigma factor (sigma-70 family)